MIGYASDQRYPTIIIPAFSSVVAHATTACTAGLAIVPDIPWETDPKISTLFQYITIVDDNMLHDKV